LPIIPAPFGKILLAVLAIIAIIIIVGKFLNFRL
jgi:hypothetical protein